MEARHTTAISLGFLPTWSVLGVALTICGMVHLVFPRIIAFPLYPKSIWNATGSRNQAILKAICLRRQKVYSLFWKPRISFLDLPYELRLHIYGLVCKPEGDGSTPGALHLLLISKGIQKEAREFFDNIPHTVILADAHDLADESQIVGMPRRIGNTFHPSIKRLILVVSICSIREMSPDTFDVNIPKRAKAQWNSVRKIVGIWPNVIEKPLEQIVIQLQCATAPKDVDLYRCGLIRYIRNFKKTNVWAETGTCCGTGNTSLLLPLARAFNEARTNWVEEADFNDNIIIRFGDHKLDRYTAKKEKVGKLWDVLPADETTRTDDRDYPPLTDAQESYIRSKMEREEDSQQYIPMTCNICLARFSGKKCYAEHVKRGT